MGGATPIDDSRSRRKNDLACESSARVIPDFASAPRTLNWPIFSVQVSDVVSVLHRNETPRVSRLRADFPRFSLMPPLAL